MTTCRFRVLVAILVISSHLAGCNSDGDDPERYVLTGNSVRLFYQKELKINPGKVDQIIAIVQTFSRQQRMDFLLARESLPAGDFNASANGPGLNIKVMHTSAVGDRGVQVFATAKGPPTSQDRALVAEFVTRLESVR